MDTSLNGQYPLDKSTSSDDGQNLLDAFWQKEIESIQNLTAIDFRNQELPLARIKKIMKLDEDVKMISAEAPILFAKAAEIFIAELSLRAWANTKDNKRRTLQRNDIAMAISKYDQFDFLIDIVPREEIKPVKRPDISNSNVITSDQLNYFFQVAQQQQQQQPIQSGSGQPVQIVQAPNQNQPFTISPQVFQVSGNSSTQTQDNSGIQPSPVVQLNASSESQSSNSDKTAISSPIILSNVYNNSGEIVQQIPITLSSQQYQSIMQNHHNSSQSQPIIINSQSLPVQTQYITNTGQVVQTIIPNNKFSSSQKESG